MGYNYAQDLATNTSITIERQLEIHLQANHFPPVPKSMVQPCIEAIDAYWDGDIHKLISLPEGVGYNGLTVAPAYAIVDAHHLEAWITSEEEGDFE